MCNVWLIFLEKSGEHLRNPVFILVVQCAILTGMFQALPSVAEEEPPSTSARKASLLNPAVLTIRTWQLFSKHSPVHIIDCQFQPSCSEYGIAAIGEAGTLRGVLYATDRVVRCNPGAHGHYVRDAEGRLLDGFTPEPSFRSRVAPQVCIPLSFALPGLNRMVNGRFADGLTMLLMADLTGFASYQSARNDHWLAIPCALLFSAFYASDIYINCISTKER